MKGLTIPEAATEECYAFAAPVAIVRWLIVAVAAVSAVPPAYGQSSPTTADLVGVVRDASGGVLPGATVTATQLSTNVARSARTDATGRFTIAALPPGDYAARRLTGFGRRIFRWSGLPGHRPDVAIVLPIAQLVENVVVDTPAGH
jgi:hypothetical protein